MPDNLEKVAQYRSLHHMDPVDIQNEVFNTDYPVPEDEMDRDGVVAQVEAEGKRHSGPPLFIRKGDGTVVRLPTRVATEVVKSFDTQLGEESFSTVSETPAYRVHPSDLPKIALSELTLEVKNEFEERAHLAEAVSVGRRKKIKIKQ